MELKRELPRESLRNGDLVLHCDRVFVEVEFGFNFVVDKVLN